MSEGIGGSNVSSSRMRWALENDGLRRDDTRHIFLGNNIFISQKGMRDRIIVQERRATYFEAPIT